VLPDTPRNNDGTPHLAAPPPRTGDHRIGSNLVNRTRLIAIVLTVIVIATSIALRKVVADQTTRMAIGIVEIAVIAILLFGFARPRARN
jgi:hypothetical protein